MTARPRLPPMHPALRPAVSSARGVLLALPELRGCDVMVALSGGPDSSLMLAALHALAPRLGFGLHATHVNHHLSHAAPLLEQAAQDAASRLGVPLCCVSVNVKVEGHEGLEAAARRHRHHALEAARLQAGCAWLMLGHTMTDVAETFLQRVLEGAGRGQAALPAIDGVRVRPLIELSRTEVRTLVTTLQLPHAPDPMNEDDHHLRVFLRRAVWPALSERFGAPDRTLARAAQLASQDHAALEGLARAAWKPGEGAVRSTLRGLPLAVRTRALRQMLEHAAGGPVRTGAQAVNKAAAALSQQGGAVKRFKAGPVWIVVEQERVVAQAAPRQKDHPAVPA